MSPEESIKKEWTTAYAEQVTVLGRKCWRVYSCASPVGLILGEAESESEAWGDALDFIRKHREVTSRDITKARRKARVGW